MKKKIEVENPEKIPAKIIAQSIVEIANAFRQIKATRLNNNALIILLAHETKLAQYQVQSVLNALGDLERLYLK